MRSNGKCLPDTFCWRGGSVVQLPNGNIEVGMAQLGQCVGPVAPGAAYRSYRIPCLYPGVQWQRDNSARELGVTNDFRRLRLELRPSAQATHESPIMTASRFGR